MTTAEAVRSFQINVPDAVLEDLHERLRRTRFPGEAPGGGWTYGTNLAYMKELVAYWLESYDWRAAEAELNLMPQFMARVNGLDLHFVHIRGTGPAPLPLLISHGWPGSFYEMAGIVGPLTNPAAHGGDPADAFDVVVPSLPGYGFSEPARDPGMTPTAIGELFTALMRDTLGCSRFGVQGGDWGAVITAAMAFNHPDAVLGLHNNMLGVRPYTGAGTPPISPEEDSFRQEAERWRQEETGYQWIQGTRPQTLAYGLTDSPAGLAAWIVEKFRAWSDCDGDVERSFTKDQLLTDIMIYWVSGCINSSTRLYYESRHHPWGLRQGERIEAPSGYASFPHELTRPPRAWAERALNIQRWTEMPRGGHFAAMEEPELLIDDVRAFFRPLRGPGKS
ncbi:MAG: epoxide hydrolase family protein [Dehalococcoidia bacterium]